MKIQEALLTNQSVTRPSWNGTAFCHYLAGTGPYTDIVSETDYFTVLEDGYLSFSTSAPDFYAADLLADDYELINISKEVEAAAREMSDEADLFDDDSDFMEF